MSNVFTYLKLYNAYLECRKNKRKTINALKFEFNFEDDLYLLLNELKNKIYIPGKSICFIVKEPKPREIFAANFRDRIVHHLFVKELIDKAERIFIYDSYACRPQKGCHLALKRFNRFIKRLPIITKKKHYI